MHIPASFASNQANISPLKLADTSLPLLTYITTQKLCISAAGYLTAECISHITRDLQHREAKLNEKLRATICVNFFATKADTSSSNRAASAAVALHSKICRGNLEFTFTCTCYTFAGIRCHNSNRKLPALWISEFCIPLA